jgi:hypothetical protein
VARNNDELTGGDTPDERPQSFSEAFAEAAKKSGLGQLKPGETPSGTALLGAIGGVRGIVESVVPGIGFLVIYLSTGGLTKQGGNLALSVIIPVVLALVFVVARAGARSSMTSAIAGAVGLAFTAALTLLTNKASTNFLPGIAINVVFLVALLVSLAVRWPLIGIVVGALFGDLTGWRSDAAKRRILTIATWLWVGLFVIRLALEVPLYIAGNVPALGIVRLITSVPLYAAFLWVTWLLVRGAYAGRAAEADEDAAPDDKPQLPTP